MRPEEARRDCQPRAPQEANRWSRQRAINTVRDQISIKTEQYTREKNLHASI